MSYLQTAAFLQGAYCGTKHWDACFMLHSPVALQLSKETSEVVQHQSKNIPFASTRLSLSLTPWLVSMCVHDKMGNDKKSSMDRNHCVVVSQFKLYCIYVIMHSCKFSLHYSAKTPHLLYNKLVYLSCMLALSILDPEQMLRMCRVCRDILHEVCRID